MISPSPTQQPPAPQTEQKKTSSSSIKIRPGQSPGARRAKNFFRPIIRGMYYLIQSIRAHKLVSLLIIIFFVASIMLTSFLVTKSVPLVYSNPTENLAVSQANINADIVTWLNALQQGDLNKMHSVEQRIPSANRPDSATYILQFSSKYGVTWKKVIPLGSTVASDKLTADVFVEVDIVDAQGVNDIVIWHFTVTPLLEGKILSIDLVSVRQALQ